MDLTLIAPEWAEALGWTLLHSLWQGALLFILLAPLLMLIKDHDPQLRYNLLCITMAALLIGMMITFTLYLPASIASPTPTGDKMVLLQTADGAPDRAIPSSEVLPEKTSPSLALRPLIHRYAGYLVHIWLLGGCFFALRWAGSLFYAHRLKKTLTLKVDADWQTKLKIWSRQLNIKRTVCLLESAKVEVPLIIGHFSPCILLPIGTLTGLTPQQVQAIILHELAHIKRNDFAVNALLSVLEVILFYHPVYWWLANQIHHEREQCCDDIAVAACGNPRLYARTLLLMEEKRQQKTLAMTYQGKKHHLLDRVKRICSVSAAPYGFEFGKAGLSALLLLVAGVISWAQLPVQLEPVAFSPIALKAEHSAATASIAPASKIAITSAISAGAGSTGASKSETSTQKKPSVAPRSTKAPQLVPLSDTLPYLANIPKMNNPPQLTAPPTFPFSKDEIVKEFDKPTADRSVYKEKIDNYTRQLKQWKHQVKETYLKPWDLWQGEVKLAYLDWKQALEKKSKGDQLAYYVALKNGMHQFSDALSKEESAIRESENMIRSEIEDQMRTLEDAIRTISNEREDREERLAIRDDRMQIHDLRMLVHDVRMAIHDARMAIHDTRMDFHDDRMDAYDYIRGKFEHEFFEALAADGLYNKISNKELDLMINSSKMTLNGQVLSQQLRQKYGQMIRKYGYKFSDSTPFLVKINDRMYQFGNSMSSSEVNP